MPGEVHHTNPLLHHSDLKDGAIPFNKITLDHYLPALKIAIEMGKKDIAQITQNSAEPDFFNTIEALETAGEWSDRIVGLYANLESSHADEEFHKLAQEIYPQATGFSSDILLDGSLFQRVKEIYNKKSEFELSQEQKQLLERTYKNFVRNGALLNEKQKESLRKIDQELSILSPKFAENVLKATNAFELWITQKEDLEGLPESALEAAHAMATEKGRSDSWLFTLQAPSLIPFLTYAKNRPLREKFWKAYNSRALTGEFSNQSLIKKIVELRHQRAQLLGYPTHAAFVLEERMAKNPATVDSFVHNLIGPVKKAALKDLEETLAFAKAMDGLTEIQPWDWGYYSEKLKQQKFNFHEEEFRPYFQLEKVIDGVFELARRLFGLTFIETTELPVYHEEVRVFEVFEENTRKYVGLLYTDFFPRKTKRGGAWMTNFREQGLLFGKVQRPHVSIVCNFTKPTPTKPSLLTLDEVHTLFHEFGHALHGILSECRYRSLAGTNVFWDFVELPSQLMENWVSEKECLDLFACHYETQQPIPREMIERLRRASQFQAGWMGLRQMQFAILDMKWHSTDPAQIPEDVDAFEMVATSETRLLPKIPGSNISCSFSHIFAGGYSAGYYSYKWAEVLDADAFEFFKEKGLFNPEVGKNLKENILQKGGTEHPMDLYKKFRGREPDTNALLRRDGLL